MQQKTMNMGGRGILFFTFLFSAFFVSFSMPAVAQTTDIKHDWSSTIGGSNVDIALSAMTDSTGNVYTAGYFTGTVDFDSGSGVDSHTSNGLRDIYFTKHDRIGNYLWTRTFGGSNYDWGYALAFDPDGFMYLAGYVTGAVDLDPGAGTDMSIGAGGDDILLAKYDLDGNYVWGRTVGDTAPDTAYGISLDSTGNVLVTGRFGGTVDFDPSVGVYNRTSNGDFDIFVSKYDSDGNHLWARTFGGATGDYGWSVVTDASNNLYVGGYYGLTVDFDPGPGTDNRTSAGGIDSFLSKYDSNGNYQWTKSFGGSTHDQIVNMVSDPAAGIVFATGYFSGTVDFDPGPGIETRVSNGGYDGYLSAFDSNGSLLWIRTFGGVGTEISWPLARTSTGDLLVGGDFSGTVDFDPGVAVDSHSSNGGGDAFFTRYTENGDYLWTKTFGGSGDDATRGVHEGVKGDIFVTGNYFNSVDFDPGPDSLIRTSNGIYDIYLSKFSPFSIDEDRLNLNLDINSTIAISCDSSVAMSAIVGTGKSDITLLGTKATDNMAMCNIKTNSSGGYKMEWNSSATHEASGSLKSTTNATDTISPFSIASSSETWSIAATASEWGAKLGSSSEGYGTGDAGGDYSYASAGGWGTNDGYDNGKWMNVPTTPFQIMQKSTETDVDGEYQYLVFAAEIGADKLQPTGSYTQEVTVTATTL